MPAAKAAARKSATRSEPLAPIGQTECPVCKEAAWVKETKKGKAMIHCEHCQYQGFTRSAHSDKLVRDRMQPVSDKQQAHKPEKKQRSAPPARGDDLIDSL